MGRGYAGPDNRMRRADPERTRTGRLQTATESLPSEVAEQRKISVRFAGVLPGLKHCIFLARSMRGLKPPPPSDETESASASSFSTDCSAVRVLRGAWAGRWH